MISKHESKSQPGLMFWAEDIGTGTGDNAVESYCVVQQMAGFPATEALDDWLCHWADADDIARRLANGEAVQ